MSDGLESLAEADELCRPPTIIGAAALAAKASIKTAFLVEGAIPSRDITIITAPPGSMKSWLAYDLVMATVRGRPWLGFQAPQQGSGLVLNYDNPTSEVGRRFLRLGMGPEDEGRLHFHSVDVGLRLQLPGHYRNLLAVVERLQPKIIMIDSMRQSHTNDENDSKQMGEIMGQLKSLYAFGASVIICHHSTIGTGRTRGSGEIDGSVTCHIALDGDTARWEKHRSWEQRPPEMPPWEEGIRFAVTDAGELTHVTRLPPRERKRKGGQEE